MSGVIYGYFSLTDTPVEKDTIETMRKANSFWEPDGDELWSNEHACLGSLIMLNTPEAIYEKQPLVFDEGRKIMVANARIDNRDDLCREFEIPLSARDIFPDSFYMKLAYEKWGEDCADHLIGDWSMAVYDIPSRNLFVARDHHGIMACYYYLGPDFFVFSSSLKGILALPQVPKKENEDKIAQILVNVNDGGPETCYLGINRLLPAHVMKLHAGKLTTRQFWFLEKQPKIRYKTEQEYVEKFRELYTEAVRCRLRSYRPVGATLSSGLDSGSVCILASQELAKYGKRLPAFTAVPLYDVPAPKGRIGNEGPYAQELAAKLGNVDVTLCNAADISPLQGIDIMLDVHDQPIGAMFNAYWIVDILLFNKKTNLSSVLIGQGGNLTISWENNNYLINILSNIKRNILTFMYPNNENLIRISRNIIQPLNRKRRLNLIKIKNEVLSKWYEYGIYYKLEIRDPTIDIDLIKFILFIPKKYSKNVYFINKLFPNYFSIKIKKHILKGIQGNDSIKRINNNIHLKLYSNFKIYLRKQIIIDYFKNPKKNQDHHFDLPHHHYL